MDPSTPDFAAQRAFIAAKIAAAQTAAESEDVLLEAARRDFGAVFRSYFSAGAVEPRTKRQILTRSQVVAAAASFHSWWFAGGATVDLAVGFNNRLVAAAADMALCKRVTAPDGAPPTPVDRSIATALASRFSAVGAGESDAPIVLTMSKPTATLEEAFSAADKRRWNALSFEGAFADDGGAFAVIVMRPDGASLSAAPAPASLSGDSFARVRSLPVVADCIGASFEAPLRRVLSLKPGDVIPIDWRGGAASLMVGGKPFAEGFVGDKSGRRAIRL